MFTRNRLFCICILLSRGILLHNKMFEVAKDGTFFHKKYLAPARLILHLIIMPSYQHHENARILKPFHREMDFLALYHDLFLKKKGGGHMFSILRFLDAVLCTYRLAQLLAPQRRNSKEMVGTIRLSQICALR